MTVIVVGIFILYFLLLGFLLIGWGRLTHTRNGLPAARISVVISVRNEERNITELLSALCSQTFKPLEVILVDDHSTDHTVEIVETWKKTNASLPLRIIKLGQDAAGKKKAIATAVAQAKGDVIVTTDADCRVGAGWLLSIATRFSDEQVKLVAGAVRLAPGNFFGELQQVEQAALTGTTAAFIVINKPVMCNGANLAYRKAVFTEVNGYEGNEHIASGDDEFLLKKISARYPQGVAFNANPGSVVTTRPALSAWEFINQRVRWAGKWRKQQFGVSSVLALFVFLFNLTFLSIPLLAMQWVVSLGTVSLLLLIKLFLELVCLKRITTWMGTPFNIHAFAALQFLYPPYVVFFGLISNWLNATWKGRKI
jgi:cellulose synthase/poly-beta-1,6-N-acetylglucosamine synthase-like glycosyltransferase